MRRLAVAIAMLIAAGATGCDTFGYCDRKLEDNPFVRYADGTAEGGVYMSAPWDGELLDFPGGAHYAMEHKLGVEPRWIQAFLSFDEFAQPDEGLAQAAGNQVVILGVDSKVIKLANDTCAGYWLLVTAGAGDPPAP